MGVEERASAQSLPEQIGATRRSSIWTSSPTGWSSEEQRKIDLYTQQEDLCSSGSRGQRPLREHPSMIFQRQIFPPPQPFSPSRTPTALRITLTLEPARPPPVCPPGFRTSVVRILLPDLETRNGMLHAGEFHFENFADDACTIASRQRRRLTVDGQAL